MPDEDIQWMVDAFGDDALELSASGPGVLDDSSPEAAYVNEENRVLRDSLRGVLDSGWRGGQSGSQDPERSDLDLV